MSALFERILPCESRPSSPGPTTRTIAAPDRDPLTRRQNDHQPVEDHPNVSDPDCAQRSPTVANRLRSLEQNLTLFRRASTPCSRFAPDRRAQAEIGHLARSTEDPLTINCSNPLPRSGHKSGGISERDTARSRRRDDRI